MTPPTNIQVTTITFPEISLRVRDAHKLRGYFGNLFQEHAPLLSNHFADGSLRYKYPEVQYKVINNIPTLVGIQDGGELLVELFLKVKHLNIDGQDIEILSKNINRQAYPVGVDADLHRYRFQTLWMALNQTHHREYITQDETARQAKLKAILTGHILGFYKTVGHFLQRNERIMIQLDLTESQTQFKNQTMLAFKGEFTTNALLPDGIGLGKSPSRGFGTIIKQ
jgi:hypothetical protein